MADSGQETERSAKQSPRYQERLRDAALDQLVFYLLRGPGGVETPWPAELPLGCWDRCLGSKGKMYRVGGARVTAATGNEGFFFLVLHSFF